MELKYIHIKEVCGVKNTSQPAFNTFNLALVYFKRNTRVFGGIFFSNSGKPRILGLILIILVSFIATM